MSRRMPMSVMAEIDLMCGRIGVDRAEAMAGGEVTAAVWFELYQVRGWNAPEIGAWWGVGGAVVLDVVDRMWERIEAAIVDGPRGQEAYRLLARVQLQGWADDLRRRRMKPTWGGARKKGVVSV